ncbi:hypothetical protein JI743_14605 [Sphingopyxis sp. DHUNG17]|uniref:hypothetical protein n=1 Tax=Sphingopyxis jiangsuensis TaxID=2871171 RepID=UPI00191E6EBF|nr:hypothetical protein [Sphingopyxis lutea]MBL0770038.1 hypothetical protein [Sphingopyxis lutea]
MATPQRPDPIEVDRDGDIINQSQPHAHKNRFIAGHSKNCLVEIVPQAANLENRTLVADGVRMTADDPNLSIRWP